VSDGRGCYDDTVNFRREGSRDRREALYSIEAMASRIDRPGHFGILAGREDPCVASAHLA
jgi:hypothetical protein